MKRTLCTTLFLAAALSACDGKSDDGKAQAENAAASAVTPPRKRARRRLAVGRLWMCINWILPVSAWA